MSARFSYSVMFVGDDGFMQHTLPRTAHVSRSLATDIVRDLRRRQRDVRIRLTCSCGWESGNHCVWAAVDEQRRYHASRCGGAS